MEISHANLRLISTFSDLPSFGNEELGVLLYWGLIVRVLFGLFFEKTPASPFFTLVVLVGLLCVIFQSLAVTFVMFV